MDEAPEGSRGAGRTIGRWALAGLAVAVVALLAGVLFGRADPQRAARLLIRDLVLTEPVGEATGPPAPTSGTAQAAPMCGVVAEPLDVQSQVDAMAAGVVVLQYRLEEHAARIQAFAASRPTEVVAGPNPDLDANVVATAWTRRMRLDDPNTELLSAFVTAHAGIGPDVQPCAPSRTGG